LAGGEVVVFVAGGGGCVVAQHTCQAMVVHAKPKDQKQRESDAEMGRINAALIST